MTEYRDVIIARVGAQGDGVADVGGAQIFVPYVLAGERVAIDVEDGRARVVAIERPSADRVAPVCAHFCACGGCSVQHMAPVLYAEWKRDNVVAAFKSRGLDVVVDPVVIPGGVRRRATFAIDRGRVGFHAAASREIVPIEMCPVLDPKIVALLPSLRELGRTLGITGEDARATVMLTDAGLDVVLSGVKAETLARRTALSDYAQRQKLARISLGSDTVFEVLPPRLHFGAAEVDVPAAAFVQAMAEAEQEIVGRILAAVGKARAVADLFSGCGAFTFPLAARARVDAFDGESQAIAALGAAARRTPKLKPVTAQVRDLFREPLSALELNAYEAIVFDPPRAGAEAQAQRIARSKVKTVVGVSCNPATLARDARILVDGGYKLRSVTPIDQFHYSAHIEAVAVFVR